MVDWKRLLDQEESDRRNDGATASEAVGGDEDWRLEAADSLAELYYETYRAQRRRSRIIDLRPGSDFRRFLESHIKPLAKHGVWEALFPNRISATSAQAIDEALHLLADTKLVDRVYSGDIVTVTKIVTNIQKKRGKYLEADGRAVIESGDDDGDDFNFDDVDIEEE